ncbi:MAG: aminotransferase class III-fold pyridoxal phosphate-dependent enzyme [Bacteroidales bacterium]|jgi:acetylornithine aminotransferase|nr:aminotransferase class III-fold pyridoxal phosphate-dependent enzyme [Bacteroidales bacterium]
MKLFDVYPLFDVTIDHGKGCYVYDEKGQEYLDFYGGHAVISIGHSHPRYLQTMQEQAAKLCFYSNAVKNPLQVKLAEKLGKVSGYDDYQLFLINSGAEANENALKLASFYTGKKKVIAFTHAFHGRTSAAVNVTQNPKIQAPINSTFPVEFFELGDIEGIKASIANGDVAAVIIEGISGVGGIHIPTNEFMQQLRKVTEKNNVVLILDEIQSGYGRSGKFFAHQYAGIRPDIITVAKGIANGYPFAGVLISPKFTPVYGQLGTTFGGNHLGCALACTVLDVIQDEKLVENAAKQGEYLMQQLKSMNIPGLKELRGRGLMIGIEFDYPYKEVRNRLIYDQHVFTGAAGINVLRILPPLCIGQKECDLFLERFEKALK